MSITNTPDDAKAEVKDSLQETTSVEAKNEQSGIAGTAVRDVQSETAGTVGTANGGAQSGATGAARNDAQSRTSGTAKNDARLETAGTAKNDAQLETSGTVKNDVAAIAGMFSESELSMKAKLIMIVGLLLLGLLSFFVIGDIASSPEAHEQTIAALDESGKNVTIMTAGALGVSMAASIIPGDAGKPVAEVLSQITAGLAVVLAVVLLEKYLITVFGFAAFKVLIPICCVLLMIAVMLGRNSRARSTLMGLASKLVVFGLALFLAIPVSVGVSSMINQTYEAQFQETIELSNEISTAAEESVEATAEEGQGDEAPEGSPNILENLSEALVSIPGVVMDIPKNAKNAVDAAANSATAVVSGLESFVGRYIEGFAVMIVTSCLIPIVVLLVFFWLANVLLGVNISMPSRPLSLPQKRRGALADSDDK